MVGVQIKRQLTFQGVEIQDENMIIDDSIFRGEIFDAAFDINIEDMQRQMTQLYNGKYGIVAKEKSYIDDIFTTTRDSFWFRENLNIFHLSSEIQMSEGNEK